MNYELRITNYELEKPDGYCVPAIQKFKKFIDTYLPLFRPINVGFDIMYDNLKPTLALNGSHTKGGSHTSRDLDSQNGAFIPIFPINLRGRTQQKVDVSRWGKGMKGTLIHH